MRRAGCALLADVIEGTHHAVAADGDVDLRRQQNGHPPKIEIEWMSTSGEVKSAYRRR